MTKAENNLIRRHLEEQGYSDIRIYNDGEVTGRKDPMPYSFKSGRVFCGWSHDLLRDAQEYWSLNKETL